jgi:RHS repeat-associated protein
VSGGGSWLSGFQARKEVTISGSTVGAQSDYPVMLTVHYGSGSDSGRNIYTGGRCQSDFGDIRFTSSDGVSELSYWMQEKTDSDQATIWVNVPSIPASPSSTSIYIYYDAQTTVSTTSSGEDVFLFYDHFTGDSLNAQWSDTQGTPTVSDSILTLNEYNSVKDRIRAAGYSWNGNVQMYMRVRYGHEAVHVGRHGLGAASVSNDFASDDCAYMNPTGVEGIVNTVTGDDGSYTYWNVYYTYQADTWYLASIKVDPGWVYYTFNGDSRTQTLTVPDEALSPRLEGNSASYDLDVDWVFVGKYVYPQPSISSWGDEETYTPSAGEVLLNLTYSYDRSGSVTGICNGTYTETYSYDMLDRLNSSSGPWGIISFGYDGVGNRVSKSVEGGSTISYSYDSLDRLVSATGMGFNWDGNGNLLYMGDGLYEWNYSYDSLNRLTGVQRDGVLFSVYSYDGGGRRVRSWDTVDGTTDYVYCGLNIVDEVNGGVHWRHVYAGSMHIASNTTGTVEYYHVDHLGSTRLKTNSSGGIIYESNYEPFGVGCGEGGVEDYRYTGKHEDITGLYYFGARYYDPTTGRFITRDTVFGKLIDPQSQNKYVYCMNNPQKYTDQDGNSPILFIIALFAGVLGYNAYNYMAMDTVGGDVSKLHEVWDFNDAATMSLTFFLTTYGAPIIASEFLTKTTMGTQYLDLAKRIKEIGGLRKGIEYFRKGLQFESYFNGNKVSITQERLIHLLRSSRGQNHIAEFMQHYRLTDPSQVFDIIDDAITSGQVIHGQGHFTNFYIQYFDSAMQEIAIILYDNYELCTAYLVQ